MTVIHRDMIDSEHRGNLVNNRVTARLYAIIASNGLEIVGMDAFMVQEGFSPATMEIHAFGLDLEIG